MKINLHSHHREKASNELVIVNQYPIEFCPDISSCSVGIHPWFVCQNEIDEQLLLMQSLALHENCLFIGEIGLDKAIQVDFELQKYALKQQLILAKKVNKPVILHIVRAFDELIAIVKEIGELPAMIIHGFNRKLPLAQHLINQGFYLSFGRALLYNQQLYSVFETIPKQCVFLETDTISNELIDQLYHKVQQDYPGIEQQIEQNFKRVINTYSLKGQD